MSLENVHEDVSAELSPAALNESDVRAGGGGGMSARSQIPFQRDEVLTIYERSRPGRRRYVAKEDVPRVFGGMGTTIMSTSRGVMTGHEARQRGVGGEVVAHVW